jgi:hypothetical protein
MELTNTELERRRRQSFVVEQLARILNRSTYRCYAIAGKLIRKYTYQFTLDVLQKIPSGAKLSYVMGALRNEGFKIGMFQGQEIKDLAERMRI